MEEAYKKLDELIIEINNNSKIKRMKELKNIIYNDKELESLLNEFHKEEVNPYSSRYIELKSKIIDNSLVKEYRNLEDELYFIVLEMNKKLNSLVDRGNCK